MTRREFMNNDDVYDVETNQQSSDWLQKWVETEKTRQSRLKSKLSSSFSLIN